MGIVFAATTLEKRHIVALFDARDEIGRQFNMAKRISGKGEFQETMQYFD